MSITVNKKAFHDYFVEEKYEAGIALEGWEVKAIRAGRMNIKESYVIIKSGEIYLIGMHISPLATASTHNQHDPIRTRKLLLHANEIGKLIANAMEQVGRDGVITVEEGKSNSTTLELAEGMQFDKGYISPYFVTDATEMKAIFDNAFILLHEKKISNH